MKNNTHLIPLLAALGAILLAPPARAGAVAYWRFEGGSFLADSAGSHSLTNHGSVTQVATPFSNPVPRTGAANLDAASFNGSNYFTADDNDAFTSNRFTLEAFFSPDSIGATSRVIAGHFGSGGDFEDQRSYALVMTNTGQLRAYISPNGGSPAQYEGPTLTAGKNYYAAMAVDVTDSGSSAITIYVQDLGTSDLQVFNYAKSQSVSGPGSYSTVHNSTAPFTIGSTGQGGALWDGAIDEVRLSNVKLAQAELLISAPPVLPLADWQFEDAPGFLADSGPADIDLAIAAPTVSPFEATHFFGKSASFSDSGYLAADEMPAWDASIMTAEVLFRADDVAGETQVLVGRWCADTEEKSWALGIHGGKIRFLQSADGVNTIVRDVLDVVAGRNYHLAVVVHGAQGTVYLKDLEADTPFASAALDGLATPPYASSAPLTVGATAQPSSPFTGLIGRVRLHDAPLAEGSFIATPAPPPPPPPPPGETPTWQEFREARFDPDVTAEANPFADPDGDGTLNLLEHALGGDPNEPGSAPLPVADFSDLPNAITLAYPKAATDVDYIAEWTDDLVHGIWRPIGGDETQDPVTEWFSRTLVLDPPLPRCFLRLRVGLQDPPNLADYPQAGGFRGIWFDLGQANAYGSKYSGGLGTYTANHVPMAHYVPEVNRTYLTWGGTTEANEKKLLILVSYYDHNTGLVARPVVVHDRSPVDDPHDNGSLSIDEEGYLWIFVSGRSTRRLGNVYRSRVPYGIHDWEHLPDWEFTYPQPWWFEGKGFFFTYTRYTAGRELYFRTSRNGVAWDAEQKLAGIGGHYQTSDQVGDRILTSFNRHPGGNVDRRTDLYYMETPDLGETWTTADGTVLTIPLTTADNPARIRDYSTNADPADNALVYICDMTADADGHPVILYITSKHHQPGPGGDPRAWMIARWTGEEWLFHQVAPALHNYDMGSIYIEDDGTWKIIAPIGAGPQYWGTGGEVELWTSVDQGATWTKQRDVTSDSPRNHSYARRPRNAHPDFYAYWADGDADDFSESHLWFTNKAGDRLWRLPYDMTEDFAAPELVEPEP